MKAELAGKSDRVMQLRQEIAENERQLDMAQVRIGVSSVTRVLIFHLVIRKTSRKYQGLLRKNSKPSMLRNVKISKTRSLYIWRTCSSKAYIIW